MNTYIAMDDKEDWHGIYTRALERRQAARLELIAIEAAIPEIERQLCWNGLNNIGVFARMKAPKVLVDFADAPATPYIFDGIEDGKIVLHAILASGKPSRTSAYFPWTITKFMRLAAKVEQERQTFAAEKAQADAEFAMTRKTWKATRQSNGPDKPDTVRFTVDAAATT
jgi:hypothetical protein